MFFAALGYRHGHSYGLSYRATKEGAFQRTPDGGTLLKRSLSQPRSYCVGCDSVLDEAGELFLVGLLVLLHQVRHVVCNVHAHDVFAMHLRVELFTLHIVTREAL